MPHEHWQAWVISRISRKTVLVLHHPHGKEITLLVTGEARRSQPAPGGWLRVHLCACVQAQEAAGARWSPLGKMSVQLLEGSYPSMCVYILFHQGTSILFSQREEKDQATGTVCSCECCVFCLHWSLQPSVCTCVYVLCLCAIWEHMLRRAADQTYRPGTAATSLLLGFGICQLLTNII